MKGHSLYIRGRKTVEGHVEKSQNIVSLKSHKKSLYGISKRSTIVFKNRSQLEMMY